MKRILRQLLSLLLTLALLLPAQAGADLNAIGHILSDMRMGGTCQTLRGDVELAVVMVTVGDNGWSSVDSSSLRNTIRSAINTLESDAAAYGAQLNITPRFYRGQGSADTEAEHWAIDVLSTVPQLAEQPLADWFGTPLLLCLNFDGRSYAVPGYARTSPEYVVYYMDHSPDTIRHELLHLYGAEDYYFHPELEAAAREHFTKSVMLDAAPGDPVDSFTAWLVGWTLQLDENATAFLQATAHLTDSTLDDARSADQQTGTGVFEWDSSTYYGDVTDGIANGAGYIVWDNGERYVGDWVWNDMTGYGTYIWPDGECYTGSYQDDLFHGAGTFSWADGESYTGAYVRDERTGTGTYTWADGTRYTGDFVRGEHTGQGTYSWPGGDHYTGDVADGSFTGRGTMTWADGDSYTGDFVDDRMTGKGTMSWADGASYTGDFVDGQMVGKGTYTWPDGSCYTGEFANDQPTGRGMISYADGSFYIGGVFCGRRNGQGTLYHTDGTEQTGVWLFDAFKAE